MKKRERKFLLILISLFFLVFTGLSFISADETSKIDDAYKCLDSLITQKSCVGLSLEEKIFSLLVTGRCESELKSDSNRNECWPRNNCNIKSTAQAILALGSTNTNTNDAEKWLISRNRTTENMIWYLQIETSKPTTCKIEYNNFNYNININEEKKLRSGAGSCLTLSASGYWLTVSQNCFGLTIPKVKL